MAASSLTTVSPTDPDMAEMAAALALVPAAAADLFVPDGKVYEVAGDQTFRQIHVDGTLRLLPGSTLRTVTMVGGMDACLEAGTADNPVPLDNPARILLLDGGPIDPAADPLARGHGVVWLGCAEVHGDAVQSFAWLGVDPKAGDTALTFFLPPKNWAAGQTIVVADMRPEYHADRQDEIRTVKGVSGATVTLDRPLDFDHPRILSPEPMAWADPTLADVLAFPVVGNKHQPVVFEGEQKGTDPVTEVPRRSHVMWMAGSRIELRGVAFWDLGRTDKRFVVTDPVPGDPASYANVRGLYPLHAHKKRGRYADPPSVVDGYVIWGGPGLGFVIHASHVQARNGFTYGVVGTPLFAETGGGEFDSEFADTLCVHAPGGGRSALGDAVTAQNDPRFAKDDFGDGGHLVWTEGGGVRVTRVYGCGAASAALALFSNFSAPGPAFEPFPIANLDPDLRAYFPTGVYPPGADPAAASSSTSIHPGFVPHRVSGCTFWGSGEGLNTWFLANPSSLFPQDRLWDNRIEDCRFVNHFFLGYSGHLQFTRCFIDGYYHSLINYGIRMTDCLVVPAPGSTIAINMAMEDTNSWDPAANGGGAPNVYERVRVLGTAALNTSQNRKRTIVLKDFSATGGLNCTLARFNFDMALLADSSHPGYWNGTHPNSVADLFGINALFPLHPQDVATWDGRYVSPGELAPDYDWGGKLNIPAAIRLNPDGTGRTTRDLNAIGLYPGGRRLPADAAPVVGSFALTHATPAERVPPLQVLSLKTTDEATYTLRVRGADGTAHQSAPVSLAMGWNLVQIPDVDGFRRGVPVERVPAVSPKPTGPWPDTLGTMGYVIADGEENLPAGASVTVGGTLAIWAGTTTDVRGLAKAKDSTLRVGAHWTEVFGGQSFVSLDVLTGGATTLTLRCTDWNRNNPGQTLTLYAADGTPLGTQTVTDFGDGKYVPFDVTGHDRVRVRADHLTWGTASISGVYLDGGTPPPPPPPPPAPTVTAAAVPPTGPAPLVVTLTATVTDASVVAWDFRDGTGATGLTVVHTFAAGDYNVRATATGAGGTAVAAMPVHVDVPPPPPPPPKTAAVVSGTVRVRLPDGTEIDAVIGGV